jgi:lipopolysaccharide biosynthesis protein
LFKNHYQPHTPFNQNYYNLLDADTLRWQVSKAKEYGVDGFCYYHYWFANGKKLLEKPIEMMLEDKSIAMPFCLSWANENWSRRWDGSENKVLMAQDYENRDGWNDHFQYLKQYFVDDRYIKDSQNRPILLIYKPQLIPNLAEMLTAWNELSVQNGLPGICFVCQYPQEDAAVENLFDFAVEFEPIYTELWSKKHLAQSFRSSPRYISGVMISKALQVLHIRKYKKFSYSEAVKASIRRSEPEKRHIPGAFTSWDNTARRGKNALLYSGSTPEIFGRYMKEQLRKAKDIYPTEYVFINAWNEWAEGVHLEADEKYGYRYLDELKRAKEAALKAE